MSHPTYPPTPKKKTQPPQAFGREQRKVPAHMPHMIDRALVEEMQARWKEGQWLFFVMWIRECFYFGWGGVCTDV